MSYSFGYYIILKNNPFIYYFSFYFPIRKLFRCLLFYSFISYITESNDRKKEYYVKKILLYLRAHYFIFFFLNIGLRLLEVYFNNHLFIYFYSKNYFLNMEEKYYICANLFNNEDILPNWIVQLKKIIFYLGTGNVYISIFEMEIAMI